jgi:hypothetical protein
MANAPTGAAAPINETVHQGFSFFFYYFVAESACPSSFIILLQNPEGCLSIANNLNQIPKVRQFY